MRWKIAVSSIAASEAGGADLERRFATILDLTLHGSVARRLAWGDTEESVLADAELVFDRLMVSVERALRDPEDQIIVIETATQVAVTVSRVVALAAVARASRERGARVREEMSHRQLKEVLEKPKATIQHLEHELRQDFRKGSNNACSKGNGI